MELFAEMKVPTPPPPHARKKARRFERRARHEGSFDVRSEGPVRPNPLGAGGLIDEGEDEPGP